MMRIGSIPVELAHLDSTGFHLPPSNSEDPLFGDIKDAEDKATVRKTQTEYPGNQKTAEALFKVSCKRQKSYRWRSNLDTKKTC